MKDFLKRELNPGDECVYLRRKKTLRGTYMYMLEKGIVSAVTNHTATMEDPDHLLPDYDVTHDMVVRVDFQDEYKKMGVFE